jgi:hypothetical protein
MKLRGCCPLLMSAGFTSKVHATAFLGPLALSMRCRARILGLRQTQGGAGLSLDSGDDN